MLRFSIILLCLFASTCTYSQLLDRPRLVVGIVVDQMRWDYLYRYFDRYGPGGFKRLVREGFSCENTMIPYLPTYTAPGHTGIYTGSVPAITGIVGNDWYRRDLRRTWYCTDDSTVDPVGSSSHAGKMSPRNMLTSTITDELRLATNFKSRVIGISLKDRGSILPAGHAANAAYWFDDASGGFISSTYYMKALPDWVKKFNDKKWPDHYLDQNWKTLYPLQSYQQSTDDEKEYEGIISGEDNSFPHITRGNIKYKYEAFRHTPGGNSIILEMAKSAIEAEKLGQGTASDFLAISFSSTDYIGHNFGPNSIETEDTYLRLDQELARFLQYLDLKIGKGKYLIFLSADHGVAHVAGFMTENRIPAATVQNSQIRDWINEKARSAFQVNNPVESVINYQLYLDYDSLKKKEVNLDDFKKWAIRELRNHPSILSAFDLEEIAEAPVPEKIREMATNGYNQKLSGDIQFLFTPQSYDRWNTGTTHGTWAPYDAHIPLLWFGWKIKPGKTNREVYMTDIAPTLAALLHIQMPNGCIGRVIEEVTR